MKNSTMIVEKKLTKSSQLKKLQNKIKKNFLRPLSNESCIMKCIKSNRKPKNIVYEFECPFMQAQMKNETKSRFNCFISRTERPPTNTHQIIESEETVFDAQRCISVIGVSPNYCTLTSDRTDCCVAPAAIRTSKATSNGTLLTNDRTDICDSSVAINASEFAPSFKQISEIHESYYENYTKTFNTYYMTYKCVKITAEKYARDFSISEFLPCSCCLCKLQTNESFTFCIKDHPCKEPCRQGQSNSNSRFKYQQKRICEECMSSMILNANKTESKQFRCIFDGCSKKFKNGITLQNHFLKHLNVKNFLCSICGEGFTQSTIKKHERTHLK
ncbi:zinc finger protein 432-like [Contarinia nasturtii]|uniref:zinc finger protein 432-like n=1 Tax=Contarinia nasturtii TaxID=265458 RepID=UPI0012D4B34D|nr:zinc finger protein 432-like [Contarinia nasturtii]